jgi:membrane protein implicated in regulation of membrane protease activity
MNGLEMTFMICGAVGGVLFLVNFLLQLTGMHHDVSVDIDGGGLDLTHSDIGFKLLSFQTITAFLTMFGLVGFALSRASQTGALVSLVGATVAGAVTAWVIALLFRAMARLQSSPSHHISDAIGQRGTVYLNIPAGGTGKISVIIKDRLSVVDAVAADKLEIKTGEAVEVVKVAGSSALAVKKV